ncbi:S9 family peptidase [Kordiimonas marina]|uniref:S9 family peptidase n=1 Tax=Kordiimonas marina TaxID=2872312 RepID=UPI001FF441D2|nr:S9 family peptidase [Kordiimonas marina]MCJ9429732.1 S9 family peptidase [Kordiimonas marina]
MKLWITAGLIALGATVAHADDKKAWNNPADIPAAAPVSVGLAGKYPADVTRFLMARGASDVHLNKDGSLMAYLSRETGVPQIWVVNPEGGQPKQLTFGGGVTFYAWDPEGKHILYGADKDGDEREAFYMISSNGTQERVVLPHTGAFRRFGAFSSDGTQFVYASTERNGRDFDIYVADTATGKNHIVYKGTFGFFPVSWQPGGDTVIVSEVRGEDANNVYFLNVKTGALETVFKPKVAASYTDFTWHWSGKRFYFATNEGREHKAVAVYDMTTGEVKTISESDYDAANVLMCAGGRYLVWTTNEGGYDKLHMYDYMLHRPASLPYLPDGLMQMSWVGIPESRMSIRINGPQTAGDVYFLKVSEGELYHTLKPNMAGLETNRMVRPEPVSFKARDGVTVHGLLYVPVGVTMPPVVVDVHGGPTSQARPSWQPVTQYLVGKGIAVLDINVRGSTGYGKTYARLDNQEKRLDSVRDLVDAVAWMKKDGRVDASRAAVMGGSYGGYMVNAVMGAYPGVFKAGASFVGVSDWVRALSEASPFLKASDRIEYGDISEKRWQEFYAKNSPINTVSQITAPMFYEHGANDPRDPVTESDRMVMALRAKGVPVEYLRFPDEGHGIRKMNNRITFYRRLAAFLEKQLKAQ